MILTIRLFMLVTFFCNTKGIFFNWRRTTKTSTGMTGVIASEIYHTSEKTSLENEFGTGIITGSEIHQMSGKTSSQQESSIEPITTPPPQREITSLENEFGTGITTGSETLVNQRRETTPFENEFGTGIITGSETLGNHQRETTSSEHEFGTGITTGSETLVNQRRETTPLEYEFGTGSETLVNPRRETTPSEYESRITSESTTSSYSFDENYTHTKGLFVDAEQTTPNIEDYSSETSIREILTEMKSNEIIERKIAKAMNEFSSNCNVYKPIIISIKNFTLAPETRIDIGKVTARFFNFHINEMSEEHEEWKTYTTTIECDSSQHTDINVSIPSKITISANIEIIDSSNEVIKKGSIRIILRGINILRQFFQQETTNRARKGATLPELELTFEKSEIALDISMAYQLPIYRRLDVLFDTLKPLQEFYMNQLEEKMEQEGISSSSGCSYIPNWAENETMTNLYTIDDVKLGTYKGLSLNAGPIIIDGLLNFDSTKFIMKKPDTSILRPNDVPENKVIKQIKTKNLKGKFEWKYHGETNVLSFTIDRISFESIFTKRGDITVIGYKGTAPPANTINTDINVEVGKVEIEPSQEKYCQNENHFANFVLSGYLQSLIGDLLHNSIRNRLMNEITLGKCDNF